MSFKVIAVSIETDQIGWDQGQEENENFHFYSVYWESGLWLKSSLPALRLSDFIILQADMTEQMNWFTFTDKI